MDEQRLRTFIEENCRRSEKQIEKSARESQSEPLEPRDWIAIHRMIRSDRRAQTLRTVAGRMMFVGVKDPVTAHEVIAYAIERRLRVSDIELGPCKALLTNEDLLRFMEYPWFLHLKKKHEDDAKKKEKTQQK